MSPFKKSYPYHPNIQSHLWIALGLGIWIFLFLFLIKPLTVDTLSFNEQLLYVPFYGLVAGVSYLLAILPQKFLYEKQQQWLVYHELIIVVGLSLFSTVLIWLYFRFVVTVDESDPWTFGEFFAEIFLPAFSVILPLIHCSLLRRKILSTKS